MGIAPFKYNHIRMNAVQKKLLVLYVCFVAVRESNVTIDT